MELIIKSDFGDVTLYKDKEPTEHDNEILRKIAQCCVYTTYQTNEVNWP